MNTSNPRRFLARGAFFALLIPLFIIGFGLATMFLWNALIPALFAGPTVSFWQAIGLILLARMLVGFGRGGRWGGRGNRGGWRKRKEYWARMQNMSPEEREAYMTSRKGRWAEACRQSKEGGDTTHESETVILPTDPA